MYEVDSELAEIADKHKEVVQKRSIAKNKSLLQRLDLFVSLVRPETVIDIGTCNGLSAIFWSLRPSVHSVETYDIEKGELVEKTLKGRSIVPHIIEKGHKYEEVEFADLVFVDGDHTYEGALSDYQALKNKCNYMIFHDSTMEGVRRLISGLSGIVYLDEEIAIWKRECTTAQTV